jgi:hypothetical protein
MDNHCLVNLRNRVFYHGTRLEDVEAIARQGFREWFQDEEFGRCARGGVLGRGIYVTCNWRTALWYGGALLCVGVRRGTRFLDVSVSPDPKCIEYLQRKYGREIFKRPPWTVLPRNKKLTLAELIVLVRYHYAWTWMKDFGKDRRGWSKWPRKRWRHGDLLPGLRSLLVRYGFHGFGNPEDEMGIVVFVGDRLVLSELVADVPRPECRLWEHSGDLAELKRYFRAKGSEQAKRLAEQVDSQGTRGAGAYQGEAKR